MVVSLVELATSEKLKDPDWGINIKICDILKEYPGKAKDVVESLRKQLGSKNPMVQCLAIILLDSLLKNCADIVHTQVAQKHIYLEIAKIGTKKANAQVLDNLNILARTWEEVYGHTEVRNPRYDAAQREHAGAAFSQISGWSSHTTAPTQTHPLTTDARNQRQELAGSAADSDFPTLSRTEIQNVHGTMDVLAEMLNALDPTNKEELKQDVIVDLVDQCLTYKQRMIDLVNATQDEEIIRKGLALNDDLQLILAKHAAIASGTFVQVQSLVDVRNHASVTIDITKHGDERSSSSASGASQPPTHLQLPARPAPSGSITPKVCVEPLIDLLSGEDYNSPTADDALAIVPVGEPQPTSPMSQHKMLALPDMFPETTMADSASSQAYYPVERTCFCSPPQFQKKLHSSQSVFYSNGSSQKIGLPLHEESVFTHVNHANPTWNVQVFQDFNQEQQQQPYYGGVTVQSCGTMPPPPWEPHPADDSQLQPMQVSQMMITNGQQMNSGIHLQSMGNDKVVGMFIQPITKGHLASMHNQQPSQSNQLVGIPRPVQGNQMVSMLPHPQHGGGQLASVHPESIQINQFAGYGCDQGIGPQFLEQSIHALSVQDDNILRPSSYPMPVYSSQRQNNPFNEDKMFGDLGHSKVGPSETHSQ